MQAEYHIPYPLFHIGYVERSSGWTMKKPHYHDAYEIYILEHGNHQYIIDDSIYDVHPYDVIMHKPNVIHKSHNTKGFKRISIYFTQAYLDMYFTREAQETLLNCFTKTKLTLTHEDFKEIQQKVLNMLHEDANKKGNTIFISLATVCTILERSKSNKVIPNTVSTDKMSPVLTYIADNFSEISSIEDIADVFYLSKYHLCRTFKEATGMTLISYLNEVRINNACSLLKNTTKSVTEIGELCGFHSTVYFCNCFKKSIKISPKEYRNNTVL